MDMQNRIPSLRDMDMAYQLDRMKPQGKMTFKEKEMEPKFKVGDKVVTPKGEWGEVIAVGLFVTVKLRESRLSTGTFNLTTYNELWKHSQLRLVNIYDEAGERWRVTCAFKRLTEKMNRPYTGSVVPPLRHRELWTQDVVNRFEDFIEGVKEKEMEPKFKVGDIVKTELHEIGQVAAFFEKHNNVRVHILKGVREGKTLIFSAPFLTKINLKEGAVAYEREGYKHIDYFSVIGKALGETNPTTAPAQPIFRLKRNDGASGWEGCHFVLVAEDEHELLVKEVDINEARVRDRVMALQKSNWTRDYSIGDEIIKFLSARGGNFTNKVVDNG